MILYTVASRPIKVENRQLLETFSHEPELLALAQAYVTSHILSSLTLEVV